MPVLKVKRNGVWEEINGASLTEEDISMLIDSAISEAMKNIISVPSSTTSDNGSILTVVNGMPTWKPMEQWSGGNY